MTREDHIFEWKTKGGNLSWRRWCALQGIPETDPEWANKLLKDAGQNHKNKGHGSQTLVRHVRN